MLMTTFQMLVMNEFPFVSVAMYIWADHTSLRCQTSIGLFLLILLRLLQLLPGQPSSSAAVQASWQTMIYQLWDAHDAWWGVSSDAAHMAARGYLFAFVWKYLLIVEQDGAQAVAVPSLRCPNFSRILLVRWGRNHSCNLFWNPTMSLANSQVDSLHVQKQMCSKPAEKTHAELPGTRFVWRA